MKTIMILTMLILISGNVFSQKKVYKDISSLMGRTNQLGEIKLSSCSQYNSNNQLESIWTSLTAKVDHGNVFNVGKISDDRFTIFSGTPVKMAMFLKAIKKFNNENDPVTTTEIMGRHISIEETVKRDHHGSPIFDNNYKPTYQRQIYIWGKDKLNYEQFSPDAIDGMLTDLLTWAKTNNVDIEGQ